MREGLRVGLAGVYWRVWGRFIRCGFRGKSMRSMGRGLWRKGVSEVGELGVGEGR